MTKNVPIFNRIYVQFVNAHPTVDVLDTLDGYIPDSVYANGNHKRIAIVTLEDILPSTQTTQATPRPSSSSQHCHDCYQQYIGQRIMTQDQLAEMFDYLTKTVLHCVLCHENLCDIPSNLEVRCNLLIQSGKPIRLRFTFYHKKRVCSYTSAYDPEVTRKCNNPTISRAFIQLFWMNPKIQELVHDFVASLNTESKYFDDNDGFLPLALNTRKGKARIFRYFGKDHPKNIWLGEDVRYRQLQLRDITSHLVEEEGAKKSRSNQGGSDSNDKKKLKITKI